MPNRYSLNARQQFQSGQATDVPVLLVTIRHDERTLARLSTDPTQRLSTEPLIYGTVSRGEEYFFVLLTAIIPDDQERSPARASLQFENCDADMGVIARSVLTPPIVDLQLVLASSPDFIEREWIGLEGTKARGNADSFTLDISRDFITHDLFPAHYMTQSRFPGLFR